jgi:hypothetical protein
LCVTKNKMMTFFGSNVHFTLCLEQNIHLMTTHFVYVDVKDQIAFGQKSTPSIWCSKFTVTNCPFLHKPYALHMECCYTQQNNLCSFELDWGTLGFDNTFGGQLLILGIMVLHIIYVSQFLLDLFHM